MAQSKRSSLAEALSNVLIGFATTLLCSPAVYWLCSVEIKAKQQVSVTALFTVVSLARSYVIRRWFNKETGEEVKAQDNDEGRQ